MDRYGRLVLSRPVPERLIESLAVAPDIPPHRIEAWVRAGGRISNNGPRSRKPAKYRGAWVTHPPTTLAKRELQAIRLLAEGMTSKAAAARMGIAAPSFQMLTQTARFRLGAETNERAVLVAAARGLVELPAAERATERLSAAESQALAMFWAGAKKAEIAAVLEIAPNTAGSVLKNARRKLGAQTTAEAARLAFG